MLLQKLSILNLILLLREFFSFFKGIRLFSFQFICELILSFSFLHLNAYKNKRKVATKFAALPWRVTRQSVVSAAKDSAKRLGGTPIELYQIHFPGPWANEAYWDGETRKFKPRRKEKWKSRAPVIDKRRQGGKYGRMGESILMK